MKKTFILLKFIACTLFYLCCPALSAEMRISADSGLTIPAVADIGEQLGLGSGVFRANPGFVFGLSADFTVWQALGLGSDIRFGRFFFHGAGADTFDFYQLSLYSFWSFDLAWLSIEPGLSLGLSQVFLTDVRNNIFALATGEGSDFPFISPHASVNLRVVCPLTDFLGIQLLFQGTAFFAEDIVVPVIVINAGLVFSFWKEPIKLQLPEPEYRTDIELSSCTPVLLGTIYFHPDSDAALSGTAGLQDTIAGLREKYPGQELAIILEGFAVPIGEESEYDLLIQQRLSAAKRILVEAGIPKPFISASTDLVGARELRPEKFWPGQRRVDIYFRLAE